jgi:hypothetical protein
MLYLTRKLGESIMIDGKIEIQVAEVKGKGKVLQAASGTIGKVTDEIIAMLGTVINFDAPEQVGKALVAAGVPIVVALNKIDKPEATANNIQRIFGQLAEHGLNPVEWGGETEVLKVSATKGTGIQELLVTHGELFRGGGRHPYEAELPKATLAPTAAGATTHCSGVAGQGSGGHAPGALAQHARQLAQLGQGGMDLSKGVPACLHTRKALHKAPHLLRVVTPCAHGVADG